MDLVRRFPFGYFPVHCSVRRYPVNGYAQTPLIRSVVDLYTAYSAQQIHDKSNRWGLCIIPISMAHVRLETARCLVRRLTVFFCSWYQTYSKPA